MSVHIKSIIREGTTLQQICDVIKAKYHNYISVVPYGSNNEFRIGFNDGYKFISLHVNYSGPPAETNLSGVYITTNRHKDTSTEIMRHLCETFGGYYNESCDNVFEEINPELFSQGTKLSPKDELTHKIIARVGNDKLNIVLELFDEYCNLPAIEDGKPHRPEWLSDDIIKRAKELWYSDANGGENTRVKALKLIQITSELKAEAKIGIKKANEILHDFCL